MLARDHILRFSWTATAAAMISLLQAASPASATASCGDWLDHSASAVRTLQPLGPQPQPLRPTPQCHGPNCHGIPSQLPLPQQRQTITSNDVVVVLLSQREQIDACMRFVRQSDSKPLVGFYGRIERPPRVI